MERDRDRDRTGGHLLRVGGLLQLRRLLLVGRDRSPVPYNKLRRCAQV